MSFKPVRADRVSQAIADQIKEAIFRKEFQVGDRLPTERQLTEQFGTSRVSVREALRTLEHSGILEIRRGADGGAFVRDPQGTFVKNFLQDMFATGNIEISQLTEARMAVEPFSASIASKRIKEDSLEQIRQNTVEVRECLKRKNFVDARLLHLEFHRLVAHASENPVIFFIVDSIMEVMESNISSIYLAAKPVESTLEFHEKIYQAMKAQDSEAAQALMFQHIQEIQEALEVADKKSPAG
jgi:GntR family transcriptional repressor for pyruvate dehydrogenase complex